MSERTQLLRLFLGNLLRYVIIPLVLIGLIVFIIWFLFIRDESAVESPTETTQTTQSDRDRKAESDTSTDNSSDSSSNEDATSNDSNGATSGNANSGSTSSNTQSQASGGTLPAGDTQELANSGPGDVLAIFLVVALIGAGAHHAYRVNRLT